MSRATYNITNDKLKAWFDDRLSSEDYQRMRKAGFIFCHGQKWPAYDVKTSKTAAEVKSELPELHADFLAVQAILQRNKERKAARAAAQEVAA